LRKPLNEPEETGIADDLCGLDLLHLAIEGSPVHALGLGDRVANAAIRSNGSAALTLVV
jgi:hypothetical protein